MIEQSLKTSFLPSEVARLVLGYLREQVCHDAAELFLRDSTHLAEYRSLLDQGYTALLTIGGRTLLDTLSLCQLEPAYDKPSIEQGELWDKLDHIVSQLKSCPSTHHLSHKLPAVKTQAVRPALRIHQTGGLPKTKRAFISPPPPVLSATPHRLDTHESDNQQLTPPSPSPPQEQQPITDNNTNNESSDRLPYQHYTFAPQSQDNQQTVNIVQQANIENVEPGLPGTSNIVGQHKKRVTWNLPDQESTVQESTSTSSGSSQSTSSASQSTSGSQSYSDVQVNEKKPKVTGNAPGKSPLKGSSKSLRNRRLFTANATSLPSTSSHSSIDSSHLSEDSSTSVHISNKQLAGSSSSAHIPTMTVSSSADGDMDTGVHLSIPDNQWTEISSLTGLQAPQGNSNTESGGTRHATTTLTLPDEQWDWSPFKQLSSHSQPVTRQTPEKEVTDTEVHDLLNELFPMKNVVQRLVEDDSWTQDLADSINRRKEDQSHLAEEKIPEVLDLTKTDPTFTDFHALLTDTNKRKKSKPVKKAVENPAPSTSKVSEAPPTTIYNITQVSESAAVEGTQVPSASSVTNFAESLGSAEPVMLTVTPPVIPSASHPKPPKSVSQNPMKVALSGGYQPKKGAYKMKNLFTLAPASSNQAGPNQKSSLIGTSKSKGEEVKPSRKRVRRATRKDKHQTENQSVRDSAAQQGGVTNLSDLNIAVTTNQQQVITLSNITSLLPDSGNIYYTLPLQTVSSQLPQATTMQLTQGSLKDPNYQTLPVYQQPMGEQSQIPITIYQTQEAPGAPVIASTTPPVIAPVTSTNSVVTGLSLAPTVDVLAANSVMTQSGAQKRQAKATSSLAAPTVTNQPSRHISLPSTENLQAIAPAPPGHSVSATVTGSTEYSTIPSQTFPTPSKDMTKMDLEQTTALLFDLTDTTPSTRNKPHGRYYTPQATNLAKQKRASILRPRTQSEGKVPPMAKNSTQDTCLVTAKWSPSLSRLIEKVSPVKRSSRRSSSGHIRHLSFSPKGSAGKARKSPFRQSSVISDKAEGSPDMNSPQLEIDYPGTPQEEIPTGKSPLMFMKSPETNKHAVFRTPPSVGGPTSASTPSLYSPLGKKRTSRIKSAAPSPLSTPTTASSLRRSPRVNRSLSQSFTPSNKPRTARVVARKGGSSGTDVHTPNKNSPSVVMAGGGSTGNISSITVAQSTPKGKNSIPTMISSPDLRRAVGAILEQSTEELLNTLDGCDPEPTDSTTDEQTDEAITDSSCESNTSDIAAALSGGRAALASVPEEDDELEDGEIADDAPEYDESAVDVARALMELASSESPLTTPVKLADDTPVCTQQQDKSLMPPPVAGAVGTTVKSPGGLKRKASPCKKTSQQAKKTRRTPRKVNEKLKKMSVQSMLDLIHK